MLLGDAEVEIAPAFKLYLHCKLSNPHFAPEVQVPLVVRFLGALVVEICVQAECTLVNFSVTQSGLEAQLLALVVRKERRDLAEVCALRSLSSFDGANY